jgi:hypothetical protein
MEYTGIEKAIEEYNHNYGCGYVVMMVDFSTGEVWTDFFISENDYKVYYSDDIHHVNINQIYYDNEGRLTKEGVTRELDGMKKELEDLSGKSEGRK